MPLVDFLRRQSILLIDHFFQIFAGHFHFEAIVFEDFMHELKDRSLASAVRATNINDNLTHFA